MSRCSTPDKLIGIGGGGSKVVYRFMEQDWILDEVMKTDEYNEDSPDSLYATVIDSAFNDDFHSERAATAETNVKEAVDKTEYELGDGFLEFDGPNLITERIPDGWLHDNVTAPASVRDLCSDQELNSWWLAENKEPLKKLNAEGFGGGVYRRRSVSKYLYHVAEHVDDSVRPHTTTNDEIAIVTTLGGGTGSGMALDMAKDLDGRNIHLYAILPHEKSTANERTNALAALSELEFAQLTGDNPFTTVTLLPHLQAVEERPQDFEMAAVRTILAHQNGLDGGNLNTDIVPGATVGPLSYAPFTMAVPYTVKYDIELREMAEDEIDGALDDKLDELRREADLYTVIEEYLRESFPSSAGAVLDGEREGTLDTQAGRGEAVRLRQRIEDDIQDTLLEQQAFRVADMGDDIDRMAAIFDDTLEYDQMGIDNPEGQGSQEVARQFVEVAPEMLDTTLSNKLSYAETDGRPYDLFTVLTTELDNVGRRRDIWKSIESITGENTALDPVEAERIRMVLREGILNDDVEFLASVLSNPSVRQDIQSLRRERTDLDEELTGLEEFYETIADDLDDSGSDWRDDIWADMKTLAAINADEETVQDAIDDLQADLQGKVDNVMEPRTADGADDLSLALAKIGPLDDFEVQGIAPLNDRLDDMGLPQIPGRSIERAYDFLTNARSNHLEHDPGRLFGTDREEEFDTNVNSLRDTDDWFEVNPLSDNPAVDENFNCRFNEDKLERDIDAKRTEAINNIVDAFESQFTEGGTFPQYEHDISARRSAIISVPEDLNLDSIVDDIESALDDSEAETPGELWSEVFPIDRIDSTQPASEVEDVDGTAVQTLFEAYLRPVGEECERIKARLSELVDDDGMTGLIDRLERLRGLSTGPSDVNVAIPEANPVDRRPETYGQDFGQQYTGIYEIDLNREIEGESDDHPYIERRQSEPEDLAGAPDHIGESTVLERDENRVALDFANSVEDIFGNDPRAPIETLEPRGTGNHQTVLPEYNRLRFRSIYLSRAMEDRRNLNSRFDHVVDALQRDLQDPDVYGAETHGVGGPDEVTMVLFVGGIFLDNISLVNQKNGYLETYESRYASYDFIGAHHSIGLGGKWSHWAGLKEGAADSAAEQEILGDFGGYVHRTETRDVDGEFMDELMEREEEESTDADPAELFLDMMSVDAYESTISMDEPES